MLLRRDGVRNKSQADRPAQLQNTVEATAKELLLPGAMVLLRTPQGDFVFGYGTTELGGTTPPRADTHFRAASNTKTMTAAVIVLLAQEGKLRLDDPVSKYVQGVPNGDNITIGELLKMRSGLYNYTAAPELAESLDHDPTRVWTPEELLAIAFKHPPLFAPGKEYDYCNTNYVLLGLIAEKIEGAAAGQNFSGSFVRAAWHEGTHCSLPARRTPSPNRTHMAICTAVPHTPWRMRLIPPIFRLRPRREHSSPMTTRRQNPSYAFAAGGVISTADDLATWMRALVGGKVFDADYQRQWLDSPEPQDPSRPRGPEIWVWDLARSPLGRTACIFTAARCPATTRSWATIRSTM